MIPLRPLALTALVAPLALLLAGCPDREAPDRAQADGAAAERTFVPPGEMDEYYLFYSGGHGGDVRVAGIPSMRHIRTIPVFNPNAAYGYGYDDLTRELLGDYTWGDVHHPALSKTDGVYDGR